MSIATKKNIFRFKISENNNLEAGLGQIWVGFIGRCLVTLRQGDLIDLVNSRRGVNYLNRAIVTQCYQVRVGFGLVRVYLFTHAISIPVISIFGQFFIQNDICPTAQVCPTQTPTQNVSSSLKLFEMIFESLQSEILRIVLDSLRSKIPGFNLPINNSKCV